MDPFLESTRFKCDLFRGNHLYWYHLLTLVVQCVDKAGREVCHWRISNGHQCSAADMKEDCAASCGLCGKKSIMLISGLREFKEHLTDLI